MFMRVNAAVATTHRNFNFTMTNIPLSGQMTMPCVVCGGSALASPVPNTMSYLVICDRCKTYRIDRSAAAPIAALTPTQRTALSEYLRTHQVADGVMLSAANVLELASASDDEN